jgi:hypothetical protein
MPHHQKHRFRAGGLALLAALEAGLRRRDFVTYAIIAADTGKAVDTASYLNINPSAAASRSA